LPSFFDFNNSGSINLVKKVKKVKFFLEGIEKKNIVINRLKNRLNCQLKK